MRAAGCKKKTEKKRENHTRSKKPYRTPLQILHAQPTSRWGGLKSVIKSQTRKTENQWGADLMKPLGGAYGVLSTVKKT